MGAKATQRAGGPASTVAGELSTPPPPHPFKIRSGTALRCAQACGWRSSLPEAGCATGAGGMACPGVRPRAPGPWRQRAGRGPVPPRPHPARPEGRVAAGEGAAAPGPGGAVPASVGTLRDGHVMRGGRPARTGEAWVRHPPAAPALCRSKAVPPPRGARAAARPPRTSFAPAWARRSAGRRRSGGLQPARPLDK